jgi:hypothetical protein
LAAAVTGPTTDVSAELPTLREPEPVTGAPAEVTTPAEPSRPDHVVAVTLLRAGAALLGVYGYLIALFLTRHGSEPLPLRLVRDWVSRPLGIGEDFGPVAVMLLLAATGFAAAGHWCGCTCRSWWRPRSPPSHWPWGSPCGSPRRTPPPVP